MPQCSFDTRPTKRGVVIQVGIEQQVGGVVVVVIVRPIEAYSFCRDATVCCTKPTPCRLIKTYIHSGGKAVDGQVIGNHCVGNDPINDGFVVLEFQQSQWVGGR